eukprot:gene16483-15551_t
MTNFDHHMEQDPPERCKARTRSSGRHQSRAIRQSILFVCLLFLLQPVSTDASYNGTLTYVAPDGSTAVAFAACAKCGSTSLYRAIYAAIYGKPWIHAPNPPWVQNWHKWPKDGLPQGSMVVDIQQAEIALRNRRGAKKLFFQVTRDPVRRYISAFHSKLQCCENGPSRSTNRSNPRTVCALTDAATCEHSKGSNQTHRCKLVKHLVLKAGLPANVAGQAEAHLDNTSFAFLLADPPCLYFDEYAKLLQRAHLAKNKYTLNAHFAAQQLVTPGAGWMGWTGEIENLGPALGGFRGLGLHPIDVTKSHASVVSMVDGDGQPWTPTNPGLEILCKLAETEYADLGFNINESPCSNHTAEVITFTK